MCRDAGKKGGKGKGKDDKGKDGKGKDRDGAGVLDGSKMAGKTERVVL